MIDDRSTMEKPMKKIVLGMTLLALAFPAVGRADKFIKSDDYKDGD